MPDYADEYRRALLNARNQVLSPRGVPKQAYQGLMQLYARMISDINRDLGSETITGERAEQLERIITRRFNQLGEQAGVLFQRRRRQVAEVAAQGHAEAINRATRAAGVSGISVSFNDIPDQALEVMMLRRGLTARNFQSVIRRGLVSAADDIDQYLQSAVGRGVSADRAAKEMAGILSRGNDDVLDLVEGGRLMKSDINRALREGDIDMQTYNRASQVLYDSQRILVTEINTAYREADLIAQDRSPIVGASKWEVSGRHYGLPSSPDVCLRKGTPVITDEGSKPIEDIEIGDKVLTHKDRFKPVTRLYRRTIPAGTIQKLRFQAGKSQPKEVIMTPNHPVLTDQGWIPAGDLQTDMTIYDLAQEYNQHQRQPCGGMYHKGVQGLNENEPLPNHQRIVEGQYDEHLLPILHKIHKYLEGFQMPSWRQPHEIAGLNPLTSHQYSLDSPPHSFVPKVAAFFRQIAVTIRKNYLYSDCYHFGNLQTCTISSNKLRSVDKTGIQTHLHNFYKWLKEFHKTSYAYNCIQKSKIHSSCNGNTSCSCQGVPRILYRTFQALVSVLHQHSNLYCNKYGQNYREGLHSRHILCSLVNKFSKSFCNHNLPKTRIISNEAIKTEGEQVYNIEVEDDNSYTANGLVVHNCTIYHESDQFGLGAGVFPTKNVPSTPHPFCGCSTSSVIMEPDKWGTGGAALQKPNDYNEEQLKAMFNEKTERHLERQVEVANTYQNLAYEVAQGFGDQAA